MADNIPVQDLHLQVVLLQVENTLTFADIATTSFLNPQAYYPSEGQPLCSLFGFADIQLMHMKGNAASAGFLLRAFHFSACISSALTQTFIS